MTTLADLKAAQIAAAERYTAALDELFAAYVHLAALDAVIANARFGGDLRTFGSNLDEHRAALHAHPLVPEPHSIPLSKRIAAQRDSILEG